MCVCAFLSSVVHRICVVFIFVGVFFSVSLSCVFGGFSLCTVSLPMAQLSPGEPWFLPRKNYFLFSQSSCDVSVFLSDYCYIVFSLPSALFRGFLDPPAARASLNLP